MAVSERHESRWQLRDAKQRFGEQPDFKDFLRSAPDLSELEIARSREPARIIDLREPV